MCSQRGGSRERSDDSSGLEARGVLGRRWGGRGAEVEDEPSAVRREGKPSLLAR